MLTDLPWDGQLTHGPFSFLRACLLSQGSLQQTWAEITCSSAMYFSAKLGMHFPAEVHEAVETAMQTLADLVKSYARRALAGRLVVPVGTESRHLCFPINSAKVCFWGREAAFGCMPKHPSAFESRPSRRSAPEGGTKRSCESKPFTTNIGFVVALGRGVPLFLFSSRPLREMLPTCAEGGQAMELGKRRANAQVLERRVRRSGPAQVCGMALGPRRGVRMPRARQALRISVTFSRKFQASTQGVAPTEFEPLHSRVGRSKKPTSMVVSVLFVLPFYSMQRYH